MDASDTIALLGGVAGLITAIGGIIAGIVKLRSERAVTDWKIREGKRDARRLAAEESEKAIANIAAVNEDLRKHLSDQAESHRRQQAEQSERITDQGKQITDLTTRVTDITRRHEIAVRHLVDRERSISLHWSGRPRHVPMPPSEIIADLMSLAPGLRIVEHSLPQKKPPDDDDDDSTRIRDPTEK